MQMQVPAAYSVRQPKKASVPGAPGTRRRHGPQKAVALMAGRPASGTEDCRPTRIQKGKKIGIATIAAAQVIRLSGTPTRTKSM